MLLNVPHLYNFVQSARIENEASHRSGTEARDTSASGYDDEASINEDEEDARVRMDRGEHAEKKQEHPKPVQCVRGSVVSVSSQCGLPSLFFLILRIQLVFRDTSDNPQLHLNKPCTY